MSYYLECNPISTTGDNASDNRTLLRETSIEKGRFSILNSFGIMFFIIALCGFVYMLIRGVMYLFNKIKTKFKPN